MVDWILTDDEALLNPEAIIWVAPKQGPELRDKDGNVYPTWEIWAFSKVAGYKLFRRILSRDAAYAACKALVHSIYGAKVIDPKNLFDPKDILEISVERD